MAKSPPTSYRWLVLLSMCVTIGVQSGIRLAFSVFYVALRDEFGWGAASTASVFSVYMLVQGACSPLIGWMLDRYGVRRLFPGAAMLVGVSLFLCSRIQNVAAVLFRLWVALAHWANRFDHGASQCGAGALVPRHARASHCFGRYWHCPRFGRLSTAESMAHYDLWLALGLCLVGTQRGGVGDTADVLAARITASGFREPPPHRPRQMPTAARISPWTLGQALRAFPFWMLFGTLLFSNLSSQVLNVHLMALLVGVGIVPMTAATAVGMVNLVSMGGRLGVGWMSDIVGRHWAYTMALMCSMLGMTTLIGISPANASWVMVLFVAIFGLSKGSGGIVIASKAADVFHGERLGTIFGVITTASGLGGALGPVLAGWIVDRTGSYNLAIWASLSMASLAIVCMWLVDRGRGQRPQR